MPTIHFIRHVFSLSTNRVGTDGLNALLEIQGVSMPEILNENDEQVTISYDWDVGANFLDNPAAHFMAHGLQKIPPTS